MALILCTGTDPVLLETRKLILEQAGHTVLATMGQRELVAACEKHSFDVAVIGQGISGPMKKIIASLIREHCPSAKILELYPPYQGKVVESADGWLEVPLDIPNNLAERVNELIAKPKPANA